MWPYSVLHKPLMYESFWFRLLQTTFKNLTEKETEK